MIKEIPKPFGTLNVGKAITIKDPSYSNENPSVLRGLKVSPGQYTGYVEFVSSEKWARRISTFQLMKGKLKPTFSKKNKKWKAKNQLVGVDCGMLSVCSAIEELNLSCDEYYKLCNKMFHRNYMKYKNLLVFRSGMGDGLYKVYVYKNFKKEIVGIAIDFTDHPLW